MWDNLFNSFKIETGETVHNHGFCLARLSLLNEKNSSCYIDRSGNTVPLRNVRYSGHLGEMWDSIPGGGGGVCKPMVSSLELISQENSRDVSANILQKQWDISK
jgi:hypothetical protein